jgi:dethiobiotin synthetase
VAAGLRRGLFVTGTDTGVGKTVVAAAIVATLRARGVPVNALKPVVTGLDEPPDPLWPRDHELLGRLAGRAPSEVALIGYGPAVSPHLAAELSGEPIEAQKLRGAVLAAVDAAGRRDEPLVIEGVGGLLVPLCEGYDVRDLARDVGFALVIAARPGLGTINHTLLTIEAARRAELQIAGVVLTPWPRSPDQIARSNRATIERLGGVSVSTLSEIASPDAGPLAEGGSSLPIGDWLG